MSKLKKSFKFVKLDIILINWMNSDYDIGFFGKIEDIDGRKNINYYNYLLYI